MLEHPIFVEVMTEILVYQRSLFEFSEPDQQKERESAYLTLRGAHLVMGKLTEIVESGSLAERQLSESRGGDDHLAE